MARRFHLALGVADLAAPIADYSAWLGLEPECVVPGEYALWRTEGLHVSIRVVRAAEAGQLRHLGWEEPEAAAMGTSVDVNGILWERFSCAAQRQEIEALWGASRSPVERGRTSMGMAGKASPDTRKRRRMGTLQRVASVSVERPPLVQLDGVPLLCDGGLDTTLVFHQGIDPPAFAAFDLLRREHGRQVLVDYFRSYLALARAAGSGLVLESPTWRANPAWGPQLGYDADSLAEANRLAIALLEDLRREAEAASEPEAASSQPILISGCIGPRGDSYVADQQMSADEAEAFHRWQIAVLAGAGVNLVSAFTVSAAPEAVGIVRAAGSEGVPVVVSFTLETDGRLPSGQPLAGADRWAAGERLPQEPCRARCGRKPGCRRSPGAGCGVPAAERAAAPPGGAGGLLRHRSTPCGRDRPGHPASALGSPAAALIPEDASPGAALHRLTNDLQHRLLAYLEQIARPRHAQ
jgi:S-methylmethionine-dependent homocysteine/selenocysteine methylase